MKSDSDEQQKLVNQDSLKNGQLIDGRALIIITVHVFTLLAAEHIQSNAVKYNKSIKIPCRHNAQLKTVNKSSHIVTYIQVSKMLPWSNARQHEQLWRTNDTCCQNHFPSCPHCLRGTAIVREDHAHSTSTFKNNLQQIAQLLCTVQSFNKYVNGI